MHFIDLLILQMIHYRNNNVVHRPTLYNDVLCFMHWCLVGTRNLAAKRYTNPLKKPTKNFFSTYLYPANLQSINAFNAI